MEKKYSYSDLRRRVEVCSKMINDRARKLTYQAGLDGGIMGIHLHNAMVGLHYGKPWEGVNYKLVRKAKYLADVKQWEPYTLLDNLYKKGLTYFDYEKK